MPTLPNMGLITPNLGGDAGTWDDKINTCFENIDAHDHTPGKGVQVSVAGLNINADLPLGGHGLVNVGKATFAGIAAPTTGNKFLFVNTADNELYWRSNAGVNVKLTSNATLNVSLVGGIVGDYSAVGAEVAYDDSNKRFTFKQAASPGGAWARLATGPVRIYEYNTTESVYVEHTVAAALAASYTVEWPAALPAETVAVKMTAAGVLQVGRTTKYRTLGIASMLPWAVSGSAALGGSTWQTFNNGSADGSLEYWKLATSSATAAQLKIPINLDDGQTITSLDVNISKQSDATTTLFFQLRKVSSAGVITNVKTTTYAGAATGNVVVTPTSFTETIDSTYSYHLAIYTTNDTPSANDRVYSVKLTYTDPY